LVHIFYGHLVHFVVIWYIFTLFGTLFREKSGNPGLDTKIIVFAKMSKKAGEKNVDNASESVLFVTRERLSERRSFFCLLPLAGLPEFAWHSIPKYTKWPQPIPAGRKIYQMSIKYHFRFQGPPK
jgi:hypothetical protein